jgi:hypothetical protein
LFVLFAVFRSLSCRVSPNPRPEGCLSSSKCSDRDCVTRDALALPEFFSAFALLLNVTPERTRLCLASTVQSLPLDCPAQLYAKSAVSFRVRRWAVQPPSKRFPRADQEAVLVWPRSGKVYGFDLVTGILEIAPESRLGQNGAPEHARLLPFGLTSLTSLRNRNLYEAFWRALGYLTNPVASECEPLANDHPPEVSSTLLSVR